MMTHLFAGILSVLQNLSVLLNMSLVGHTSLGLNVLETCVEDILCSIVVFYVITFFVLFVFVLTFEPALCTIGVGTTVTGAFVPPKDYTADEKKYLILRNL